MLVSETTASMTNDLAHPNNTTAVFQGGTVRSENFKTLIYLAVAAITVTLAVVTYPWIQPAEPSQEINKPLFDPDKLTPDAVAALEIVRYEPDNDRMLDFMVERNAKGIWTIPSSDGYPADAAQQMKDAVTGLGALTIVDVIPDAESQFADYGVIEPDRASVEAGQRGVGVLLRLRDVNRDVVASAIIGNQDEDRPELRFVRKPGQPLIYVVEYDPSVLKTDFRDWIEKDLLQLNSVDIAQVRVNDYQLFPEEPLIRPRYRADLKSEGTRWSLASFLEFDEKGTPTERTIGPTEELNNVRLNKLASTLDTLEIIDVVRKPEGLGSDLSAADTNEQLLSLASRGFVPVERTRGVYELLSANGEMTVSTRDGVRYMLRFGNIRSTEASAEAALDRFMMVSVSLDESAFPMPEPPSDVPATTPSDDADIPPAPALDDQDEAPAPAPADGGQSLRISPEQPQFTALRNTLLLNSQEESTSPQEPEAESPATEAPATETPAAPAPQEETPATSDTATSDTAAAPQEPAEDEAKRREAEYRRLVDERDEKLAKAKERVAELNRRFADWYYVISEESFKSLRIERGELIVPQGTNAAAEAEGQGFPPGGGFEGLQIPGLPGGN